MVGRDGALAPRRLPDRPPGRGRSRDRRGPAPRARAPAIDAGDDRVGELRAPGGPRRRRLGAHQQVRRGLPGPSLLRRLRGGRRRRGAGDLAREGAVRGRPRQRPAARRGPGQQRRLHGDARARRHDHGHGPRPRRPSQPRDEAQRLGQALRGRPVPRAPRGPPRRHGRGRPARRRAQAEGDRRRLVGLSADPRLRRLPRGRRLGRRPADGRHGALRGPRRRRRAPEPGRARRRGHDDDPQDALRPAQRHDPLPRGARQGHQPLGVPRPAGRSADAHHRRQGGGARDRAVRAVPRASASDGRQRARLRRRADRQRHRRAHRRHRRAPRARRSRPPPASTASRPRTAWRRSASRSTATRSRSTSGRR